MTDKSGRPARIWFVGPLPPPLHGQSNYNAAMATYLAELGDVEIRDTGRGSWRKVGGYVAAACSLLVSARRDDVVYTSAPGQDGLWLFALVVLVLRVRRLPFFVHHHSFRPINAAPMPAMRAVVALGGTRQRHILLSPGMRDGFARAYLGNDPARAHVLSNAFLFCGDVGDALRSDRPLTLGHMSVLAREKGVDTVLALFERLVAAGQDVRLILAGPVRDPALHAPIAVMAARFPGRFESRGQVKGAAKQQFYDDIDLFLLPSRLPDEAEPLVLLEAYAAGVDVMATARGCIPERLIASDRILVGDDVTDAPAVLALAGRMATDWSATRRACRDRAVTLRRCAGEEAAALFVAMNIMPSSRILPAPRRSS